VNSPKILLLSQQFRVAITFNMGQVANLPDILMPPFYRVAVLAL
jgi:hypothetical protein